MHNGNAVGAVHVRVGVQIIGSAMSRPAGVPDANLPVQPDRRPGIFGDPPLVFCQFDTVSQGRDPERIISPVLEFF